MIGELLLGIGIFAVLACVFFGCGARMSNWTWIMSMFISTTLVCIVLAATASPIYQVMLAFFPVGLSVAAMSVSMTRLLDRREKIE